MTLFCLFILNCTSLHRGFSFSQGITVYEVFIYVILNLVHEWKIASASRSLVLLSQIIHGTVNVVAHRKEVVYHQLNYINYIPCCVRQRFISLLEETLVLLYHITPRINSALKNVF